jgi:hypothetical protein
VSFAESLLKEATRQEEAQKSFFVRVEVAGSGLVLIPRLEANPNDTVAEIKEKIEVEAEDHELKYFAF